MTAQIAALRGLTPVMVFTTSCDGRALMATDVSAKHEQCDNEFHPNWYAVSPAPDGQPCGRVGLLDVEQTVIAWPRPEPGRPSPSRSTAANSPSPLVADPPPTLTAS